MHEVQLWSRFVRLCNVLHDATSLLQDALYCYMISFQGVSRVPLVYMVENCSKRLEKDVEYLAKPRNIQEPILHKGKKAV